MNALRAAVGVLLVAVVGLIVATVVFASNAGDAKTRAKTASADAGRASDELRKLSGEVKALASAKPTEPVVTQADLVALRTRLADAEKRVKVFEDCMPEIQGEIDSLRWNNNGGYIEVGQQLSRPCSKVIYGPPGE
jgi:hypothetical protein